MIDQAESLRKIVSERVKEKRAKAHVIAIGSGKGGCGKTNLTLNLGLILSKNGKRTLIFDADLNLANVDILLGITPKYRFLNFINGDVDLKDVIVKVREKLELIPANSGIVDFPKVSGERIFQVLDEVLNIENNFDFILIDTPAGISEEVVKVLGYADDYILVVTPEPTSIIDAYAVIKIVYYRTGKQSVKLVVNNVNSQINPSEIAERLSIAAYKFLGVKVNHIGSIPYDPAVPKSVMMQKPFVESFPRSNASIALMKIAENLLSLDKVKKQNSFFWRLTQICGL